MSIQKKKVKIYLPQKRIFYEEFTEEDTLSSLREKLASKKIICPDWVFFDNEDHQVSKDSEQYLQVVDIIEDAKDPKICIGTEKDDRKLYLEEKKKKSEFNLKDFEFKMMNKGSLK